MGKGIYGTFLIVSNAGFISSTVFKYMDLTGRFLGVKVGFRV